jgi:putative endonuclease
MYKGYTKNLKLRLEQHQKGLGGYTKDKGRFKLIYFEGCLSQQDATHREKYLKTYLGRMFLKNRLKSYLTR